MKKNVKETIYLVVSELVKILCGFRGCSFVSAMWVSDADKMNDKLLPMKDANGSGRALKVNNPLYGRLSAVFYGINLQFGIDYENSVNNRLEKKGSERDFSADKLSWGEWYEYTDDKGEKQSAFPRIIIHKGNFYIRLYKAKNTNVRSIYYLDGVRVPFSINANTGRETPIAFANCSCVSPFSFLNVITRSDNIFIFLPFSNFTTSCKTILVSL